MDHDPEAYESRYLPYLAGRVGEAWSRCLPVWSGRGRVNDFPRAIRFTRYLPSFETILGRRFVGRFADDYPFLLDRLQFGPDLERICAFDLLDFLVEDFYVTMSPLPAPLRDCDLPLPDRVRREVDADWIYRDHGLDTIGKLFRFEHNGQVPTDG